MQRPLVMSLAPRIRTASSPGEKSAWHKTGTTRVYRDLTWPHACICTCMYSLGTRLFRAGCRCVRPAWPCSLYVHYIKTPAFQHTIRIVLLSGLYRPPRNLEQRDRAGVRIVAFYTLSGPYRSCRNQDIHTLRLSLLKDMYCLITTKRGGNQALTIGIDK